jgi:ABC-type uncharacterized transport system ATPase subunit
MALLSVTDLTVKFDDFVAVKSVSFAIKSGETLAVRFWQVGHRPVDHASR